MRTNPTLPRPPEAVLALVWGAIFVLWLGAGGCTQVNSHPGDGKPPKHGGILYHLPMNMISVNATATKSVSFKVDAGDYSIERKDDSKTTVEISRTTIADLEKTFILEISPRAASSDNMKVTLSEQGLLAGINLESSGQGATLVTNTAKLVGTVVGAAVGLGEFKLPSNLAYSVLKQKKVSFEPRYLPDFYSISEKEQQSLREDEDKAKRKIDEFNIMDPQSRTYTQCTIEEARSENMDALTLKILILDKPSCQAWKTYVKRKGELQAEEEKLALLPLELPEASYQKLVAYAKNRAEQEKRIANAKLALTSAELNLNTRKTAFLKANNIKDSSKSKEHLETFSLAEMPRSTDVEADEFPSGLSEKMLAFAKKSGVVFSCDPVAPEWYESAGPDDSKKQGGIFYRTKIPYQIRAYEVKVDGAILTDPKLNKKWRYELIDTLSPPGFLAYKTKAFGDRGLVLAFNEDGTLKDYTLKTTSTAAGMTGGAATGTQSLLEQVETSLSKTAGILAKRAEIKLNALQAKQQQLEAEQGILDAQIALEGATASRQLLVRKLVLENQLASVKAAQDYALAGEPTQSAQDLAQMKSDLELLKQRIELLKAQQELDKLERGEATQ